MRQAVETKKSTEHFQKSIVELINEDQGKSYLKSEGFPLVQYWVPTICPLQPDCLNQVLALAHITTKIGFGAHYWTCVKKIQEILSEMENVDLAVVSAHVNNLTQERTRLLFGEKLLPSEEQMLNDNVWVFLVHEIILQILKCAGAKVGDKFHHCYLHLLMTRLFLTEAYRKMSLGSEDLSFRMLRHFPAASLEALKDEKVDMLFNSSHLSLQKALSFAVQLGVPFMQKEIVNLVRHSEKNKW